MFHPIRSILVAVLAMAGLAAPPARADINVGVTLSLTGPAASLGMPAKRAIDLLPKEVAGQKLNFILLDDTSDPSVSVRNFRRLVDEHKVDVVMGSSVTPSTIALVDIAAETKVPLMSLAASARIVEPQDEKRRWALKAIQNENLRPVAQDFIKRYEAAYGPNSASIFSANVWDAGLVLRAAIPAALGKGKPGTEAFRTALRDALESTSGVVTTQGVTTMSRTDHVGYDKRAAVLVQIQNGVWKYLK